MKSLLVNFGVVLAIGFSILINSEVWGEDWRLYEESKMESYYYDAESITRISKNTVRVWDKCVYTEAGKAVLVKRFGDKYINLLSTRAVFEINCVERKHRLLHVTYFSKDNEILNSRFGEGEWRYIAPDSVDEALFKAVCK